MSKESSGVSPNYEILFNLAMTFNLQKFWSLVSGIQIRLYICDYAREVSNRKTVALWQRFNVLLKNASSLRASLHR